MPKGFIKSTRRLGQDEIDALKAVWQSLYANDQSNVIVLDKGLEFQEANNTNVETKKKKDLLTI